MSENNSSGNSDFISARTSSGETQEQVPVVSENVWLNQLNGTQLTNFLLLLSRGSQERNVTVPIEQYERIRRDYDLIKIENNMLRNANITLALRTELLFQQNRELTEENEKLKSEHEIRQERANNTNTTPVQTTRFSILGAIDQIKQSTEKENRPNCEIDDNKSIDKNN